MLGDRLLGEVAARFFTILQVISEESDTRVRHTIDYRRPVYRHMVWIDKRDVS